MDGQSKGDKRDYRPPSQILELTSDPVLLEQLRGKLEEYEKRHEGLVYQPPENPQKREVWLKGHVLGTLLDTGRVDLEEMALKLMHPKDKSGNEIKGEMKSFWDPGAKNIDGGELGFEWFEIRHKMSGLFLLRIV